jgi:fermentation-respiration switch protein FrsA (DUF1100 family)
MNWFNINRNIPIHGVTNNFSVDRCRYSTSLIRITPRRDRSSSGVAGAPSDNGYTKIYSTAYAFAALKADGSITAWGSSLGGAGSPPDSGYTKIYSNPPQPALPHTLIDPSALRAAKAYLVE